MSKSMHQVPDFSARLREVRERRQLTQAEVATKAGLQTTAISHFEAGTRKPSFDNLRRLADALNVTTDYLLGRVNREEALTGADTLHRHFEKLSENDRWIVEDLARSLAERNRSRHGKRDE